MKYEEVKNIIVERLKYEYDLGNDKESVILTIGPEFWPDLRFNDVWRVLLRLKDKDNCISLHIRRSYKYELNLKDDDSPEAIDEAYNRLCSMSEDPSAFYPNMIRPDVIECYVVLGEQFIDWYTKITNNKSNTDDDVYFETEPAWPSDFKWVGKEFVFGNFGPVAYHSKKRIDIFNQLTDAKGNWVATKELGRDKPKDYVGKTIAQMESAFPIKARKKIVISSTQAKDDLLKRPNYGAYRIRVLSNLDNPE